jgi:MYXO-CTERM domain-containing protein
MARWSIVAAGAIGAIGLSATPATFAALSGAPTQLDLAAMPAIKLVVTSAGWQHVSQPALVAAGLAPGIDPAQLQLFADGVEQSLSITGDGDGVFDSGDAIEFYGQGRDTLWTGARTYWLIVGTGTPGKRVPLVVYPASGPPPESFPAGAVLRQQTNYFAALKNGDASNFFGDLVSPSGVTESVTVTHVDGAQAAGLQVVLQGVTAGNHQVAISLDGQPVGVCAFAGQASQTCAISPVSVLEGANDVVLVGQGDSPDESLVASVEIDYQHLFVADGNALSLTAPPATPITIAGFSSPDVRVMDVTDPTRPIELVTSVAAAGSSYTVTVNTPGETSWPALYAFAGAAVLAPSSVVASRPSRWTEPRAGEMVILSNALFIDALAPLVAARRQQGWSVQLVDLQDVYDEFGAGDKTPFAVHDFLRAIHGSWTPAPRFVLLVGDASFDSRNFLGKGDFDFAPTKLIDTQQMETASDGWFVDWDSDGVEDIAIGRLSVRTASEASTVVRKIVGYGGAANLPRGGLFVADADETGLSFEEDSRASAAAVTELMPTSEFFLSQPSATEAALLPLLDEGPFLVNYMGHGSVSVWDGLFSGDDAAALTNAPLSIYVSMNCLNGFFHDVYTESLAETLTKAPVGGAVAVWASSTLSSFDQQGVLDRTFVGLLTRTSLGEAAIAAKRAITDIDAQRTWILFGDPTLFGVPIPPPAPGDGGLGPDGSATDAAPPEAGVIGDAAVAADGGMLDGGRRDGGQGGGGRDAAGADAASLPPPNNDGCGCELSGRGSASELGLFALMAAAGLGVARRRRSLGAAAQGSRADS